MKVTVSVAGRFHAFYLAKQLLDRGYLERLITSYPKFEVKKYGIPREKVRSVIVKEVLLRGWQRLPRFVQSRYDPSFFIAEIFDYWASLYVFYADIFIGWSNKSLHSLRRAREKGSMTILERGSSHMVYHRSILKEEYERWGIRNVHIVHPRIEEKELLEYEETDYIEVPSSFAKRTFIEQGVREHKIIQGMRGVDLRQFPLGNKTDNIFRLIFVGGMSLQKGTHYLLQAWSELRLTNAELVLVGGMALDIAPFFKKYEGCYRYVGHVPQDELYTYYHQASAFVMPSIQEGFAVVQLQAMACGLPLICTTNTGGEDVVEEGKNGFVIPIRDVETLKEKIIYFYDHPQECREMGLRARKKVEEGFTWDHYGAKVIPIYEEKLAEFRQSSK